MIKKRTTPLRMKVKQGDTVRVLSGKDRGKTGKVIRALPRTNQVIVEGINIVTKHQRRKPTGVGGRTQQQYGRIQMPAPIFAGKVMLVCPHCGKPTRVNRIRGEHDHLVRVCKKCAEIVDAT